ncbi:hypothetical protein LTR66_009059 [Elasticomyces elasticus]|nr:hypothetical protein LTR66_009059 [Elasticomyces elasticus]
MVAMKLYKSPHANAVQASTTHKPQIHTKHIEKMCKQTVTIYTCLHRKFSKIKQCRAAKNMLTEFDCGSIHVGKKDKKKMCRACREAALAAGEKKKMCVVM